MKSSNLTPQKGANTGNPSRSKHVAEERGRPSLFTKEIAETICAGLADGKTLREVCRAEGMPTESCVRAWVLEDREGFYAQYTRAREIGYHGMADELVEISDDGKNDWMVRNGEEEGGWQANGEHLQRSRLRVDTRKWLLSKALPKIYGDKVVQEGNPDNPVRHVHEVKRTVVDPRNTDS